MVGIIKKIALFMAIAPVMAGAADVNVQMHRFPGETVSTLEVFDPKVGFAFVDHSNTLTYGEASFTPKLWVVNPTVQCEFGASSIVPINDVALVGVDYKGAQLLYRTDGRVQATYVWCIPYKKVQFTGFIDVTKGSVIAQPQVWVYVAKNAAIGSEMQIFNNSVRVSVGTKLLF